MTGKLHRNVIDLSMGANAANNITRRRGNIRLWIYEVFEVLFSPVRAFKKIVAKPSFKGVFLVFVLVIFSMLLVEYVAESKFFLETRMPDDDSWTELLTNQHNWTSKGSLSLDGTDYKIGTIGNHSIGSLVFDDLSIWIKIIGLGPIDCSEETGYTELLFWIKWAHSDGIFPTEGATLRLFSGIEDDYFEFDITSNISSSDEWKNSTLEIGLGQGWKSVNSPNWQEITGLEFELVWSIPANLSVKIDGLHFRKYVSPLETGAFNQAIIPILMSAAVTFSMNWILWSGILLMIAKVFREELGPWTGFFIIIGHVFIATVVYTIARAVLFSTLPALNLPIEPNNINFLIHELWSPYLAYQVGLYLFLIGEIWIALLCTIVIRNLRGITYGRAASISVVAFIIRFMLRYFFGV